MVKQYKKYGVTTDGYRGDRAILTERVIEGFEEASFTDSILRLDESCAQTIHLSTSNTSEGYYIILPNAQTLWNNWKVTIINDSNIEIPIYYYTNNINNLSLFKNLTSGGMVTCLLLDDSTEAGTWTTFRTSEQSIAPELSKFTTNIFETTEVTWNKLAFADSDEGGVVKLSLGEILTGTAVRSVYVKTLERFTFNESGTLSVTIGTDTDDDHFIGEYTLTNAVADDNFTKDYFEEILSTTEDQEIYAYFTGTSLEELNAGKVQIVVEKAKVIDPTTLVNPIVQTQVPLGVIMNYAFNDLPEGYWRLDGSLFPNATASIPQFVQKLEQVNNSLSGEKLIVTESVWQTTYNLYGSCGKFAWVGGALRFPLVTNFIQGLNNLAELSKLTPAGVPNITGTFAGQRAVGSSGSLVTVSTPYQGSPEHWVTRDWDCSIYLDASRSSSVYGNSNTVQPQSIKYPYIISVYSKIQNASDIVLDEIIADTINKADISLNNLNAEGKNTITNACIPDYASGIAVPGPTASGTYIQVLKNSFVELNGNDPYTITAFAYVSPDSGLTVYQVGHFYSDFNNNTRGTSFTFFVPAGWYFTSTFESGFSYYIYPLKGAQ